MNKRNIIIFSLSILGVFIFLAFFLQKKSEYTEKKASPDSTVTAPSNNIPISEWWGPLDPADGMPYPSKLRDPKATPFTLAVAKEYFGRHYKEKLEMLESSAEKMMLPVEIYGRVVDQNGNGVAGVKITCVASREYRRKPGLYDPLGEEFWLDSDEHGFFEIKGFRATRLSIWDWTREGYRRPGETGYNYVLWELQPILAAKNPPATREQPLLLPMWKSSGVEPMWPVNGGLTLTQEMKTRSIRLNVFDDPIEKKPGPFQISGVYFPAGTLSADGKTEKGAQIVLEVSDGGVIQSEEWMPFYAPETGYQPKLTLAISREEMLQKKRFKFYFKRGNPVYYGRIDLTVQELGRNGPEGRVYYGDCDINFYTNPSGSRNLEYDKKLRAPYWKDIRPAETATP